MSRATEQALEEIAPDVWRLTGPGLRQPGGFVLPTSATVLRLPDRTLLVYSPIAIGDATAAALGALGEVAHVVAPSRLHHLFAGAAAARWPRAVVHAAPGVAEEQPALRVDRALGGAGADAAWGGAVTAELIGGAPRASEVVLFHRPSGTLLCADLIFHVTRPANLRTRLVLAAMGTGGGRLAQSRAWRLLCRDRAAARASVARVLAWPIERVAPCHGEPVAARPRELAPLMARLCGARAAAALAAGAPA